MPFNQSKKVIFISTAKDIEGALSQVLNEKGLSIASAYPYLYSIKEIQATLAKNRTTTFIRNELMRFIKETGFPYAIIIDSQIETGNDPLKILKTLLISYIILSRGKDFKDLIANIVILTRGAGFADKYQWDSSPHGILEILNTSNDAVNTFVTELKSDKKRFNAIFFIKFLNSETANPDFTLQLDNIIKAIDTRNKFHTAGKTGLIDRQGIAASIVYRIDNEAVYRDGTIRPAGNDDINSYKEGEFYVIGHWSNTTQLDVSERLLKAITRGLADRRRFKKDEPIVINMDDRCSVDNTTAVSLAQLIIKGLAGFSAISLSLSTNNYETMKTAKGFSMIKNIAHKIS